MSKGLLINIPSSKYVDDISKEYALYTCSNRAIPYASDGLKPGQRIALYLMQNKAEKIKTISLAGEMISSNLYLHGDASASDSIGKMAAPYLNNIPMINGHGTFGTKVKPYDISAPRYTYVKRSKATTEILYPDKDILPMQENYDGSKMQPTHFLPIIPIVLLNGVSGIATGYSTDILPRDFKQLINATKDALYGREISELSPCYMYNNATVVKDVCPSGNKYIFIGKFDRLDATSIRVTELPPAKLLEKFREQLDVLEESGYIKEYTDNSSDTIDVEIKFKRGELANMDDDKIVKLLKLTERKTERIVTIGFDNKNIREFASAEELIKQFVDFRFGFYVKRYEKLLKDDTHELKYWNSLKICFDKKLVDFINDMESKQMMVDFISALTESVSPSIEQIEKIAALPAYQLTLEFKSKCEVKIAEIEESILSHNGMLNDHSLIKKEYIKEVDALSNVNFDIKR